MTPPPPWVDLCPQAHVASFDSVYDVHGDSSNVGDVDIVDGDSAIYGGDTGDPGGNVVDELNPFVNMALGDTNTHFTTSLYHRMNVSHSFAKATHQAGDLMDDFHMLLDSGCTHHIFRDRRFLSDILDILPVAITAVNCGTFHAPACGTVTLRFFVDGVMIDLRLHNCLYVPDLPVNLISVGRLAQWGVQVVFGKAGISVVFPDDHPVLPSRVLPTISAGHLVFVQCVYVTPAGVLHSLPVVAAPSFIPPPLSPELWHQRFGHLGRDAVCAVLTQDYVSGAKYVGSLLKDQCVSCIIGKAPQSSYDSPGNCASAIGALLHIDICGPYSTQTPSRAKYFFTILDDFSNFGFTNLLAKKSDAYSQFLRVEAAMKRQQGAIIKVVCMDGAKEFVEGPFARHLVSNGVVSQVAAPYAHQQNGKAERFIRTLEEGSQTLLVASGLSAQFWGDAVLTVQYLRNHSPTSTLPVNTTAFSRFYGRKPDVEHFRVWGCLCFVAIPPEKREKAGPCRYPAIFARYEEDRLGWRVQALSGKYDFSRDVIFDETKPGRMGVPRSVNDSASSMVGVILQRAQASASFVGHSILHFPVIVAFVSLDVFRTCWSMFQLMFSLMLLLILWRMSMLCWLVLLLWMGLQATVL